MKEISITLEGEEAVFFWKEGKVYCEGYDLESEKAVLALVGYGQGVGVLFVAINDSCKSEAEFMREGSLFVVGYKEIISRTYKGWPKGQLLFEYLSYSPDSAIRWRGMEYKHLSERHYKRIWKDPEVDFKIWMAGLYELPEKYFHALANLSNDLINHRLARNQKCPENILKRLAKDKAVGVRRIVALNPACTTSIFEILSKDDEVTIRLGVAKNRKCTESLMKLLARDKNKSVRDAARERLKKYTGIER